jgi:predicted RNase H-like HicB family nuclease
MPHYFALVHKDAESAFGVEFPDLPGCFSAADSFDEVLPNAIEAVELYLEDMAEAPPPQPLEQVRERYAAELSQGAFLLPVPVIQRDTAVERINVSLERGMLRAIDEAAALRRLSRSAFIAQAAANEIRRSG